MDWHHGWMFQLRGDLRFFNEPENLVLVRLFGVQKNLHGNMTAEVQILGIQDRAHPTFGHHIAQFVLPALFVRQDLGGRGIGGAVQADAAFELLVGHELGDGDCPAVDVGLEGLFDSG